MTRKEEEKAYLELLIRTAINEDETSNAAESTIPLYTQAVEYAVALKKRFGYDDGIFQYTSRYIPMLLNRAEEIKKLHHPLGNAPANANDLLSLGNRQPAPARSQPIARPTNTNTGPTHTAVASTSGLAPITTNVKQSMTPEEIQILKEVSFVNNNEFKPYIPNEEQNTNFRTVSQYKDNYKMPLSDSMKKIPGLFWQHIPNLYTDPVIFHKNLSAASLKQGSIGDCSLICSIAVSADYEFRRFPSNSPPLLSKLIYPTNPTSTNGKYLIVLHFNGCRRKVEIDDTVPVDPSGRMLTCTASTVLNPNDRVKKRIFLPTLIEKAYMKMMGGYNFPGSNSGVDMHTLFGWIPERINFTAGKTVTVGTDHMEHDAERWYDKMLLPRFKNGDCLITISTPQVIPANLQNLGIENGHAYAVLDVRKTTSGNHRMIKADILRYFRSWFRNVTGNESSKPEMSHRKPEITHRNRK